MPSIVGTACSSGNLVDAGVGEGSLEQLSRKMQPPMMHVEVLFEQEQVKERN